MTSIIEDKLYELITKEDNFDFAFDINERFGSITERIINEFWSLLIVKFKKEYPSYNFKDRIGHDKHFDMSIKSLTKVMLFVEIEDNQFQYGISITHNGSKKKIQELEDKFADIFEESEITDKNKVYWFFEIGEDDFSTLFGLKKILPDNRDLLIEKYLNDFKVMVESKQSELTQFETNT